jgi:hypothetical protein
LGWGLKPRISQVEFPNAPRVIAEGLPDLEVLKFAAEDGRILVTSDLRIMPGHFAEFLHQGDSRGLVLIPGSMLIGESIESIIDFWES